MKMRLTDQGFFFFGEVVDIVKLYLHLEDLFSMAIILHDIRYTFEIV